MTTTGPATAGFAHVTFDDDGTPVIGETTMKVVELVMAQQAHGWSPEELRFQYPHLTLGQIHSALAYYWDHKDQLDADIGRRAQRVDRSRSEAGPSPVATKLRNEQPSE